MSPNGQGALAIMGTTPTTATTVTLDSAQTLGVLKFNNTAGYTLTPGVSGSLTLSTTGGNPAQIIVAAGAQSIAAPLTLAGTNTSISLYGNGALNISGSILDGSGGSSALVISSSDNTGLLTLSGSNNFAGGTTVMSGTLILGKRGKFAPGWHELVDHRQRRFG